MTMVKSLLGLLFMVVALTSVAEMVVKETGWLTSREQSKIFKEMRGTRTFPGFIEGKIEDGIAKYNIRYIPYLPGMTGKWVYWGMSANLYYDRSVEFISDGFTEYFQSTYTDLGGNVVYNAVWVRLELE